MAKDFDFGDNDLYNQEPTGPLDQGQESKNTVYRMTREELNQDQEPGEYIKGQGGYTSGQTGYTQGQAGHTKGQGTGYGSTSYQNNSYTGQTNDYGYYQSRTAQNDQTYGQAYQREAYTGGYGEAPGPQRMKPKKKKKKSFGGSIAKVACLGLVFGLVAGGTMWAFQGVTGRTTSSGGGGTAAGVSVNIVRTSTTDVQTIEAQDVSDVVAEVMPSIVAVNTVVESTATDWFGRTYSQQGSGAGSGIIFSEADGKLYVVTNNHVIEGATSIQLTFNEGHTADATVMGRDENADIAVLIVDMSTLSDEAKAAIKVAVIGDSSTIKAGNGAIAIGNALGYGQSVSTGTISAAEREVSLTDGNMTLIQTTAAINPGNSGGALLNTKGEVIGINTVKYADTSVEGMGFAIPMNSALETITGIMDGSIVTKSESETPYLGIRGGTMDAATAQQYGVPTGVYVSSVSPASAAERAGLQAGSIITGFNGQTVSTMEELQEAIADCNPGDTVTLEVAVVAQNRSYTTQELTTILGSMSEATDTVQ